MMRALLTFLVHILVFAPLSSHAEQACLAGVASLGGVPIHRVALGKDEVQLTFIGHSTFLIESPQGVRIATDFNDYVKPSAPPDIITMNHAHDTHFTHAPDPAIKHVLRGWGEGQGRARHDLVHMDARVRNVPTNIRRSGDTEFYGNSIFIFEIAGLCIAHLGHLHHTLTPEHLKAIGQLDVVLMPVDGSYTLDREGMIETLATLSAPLMIPMHYFGQSTLKRFLDDVSVTYEVKRSPVNSITLSRATLPVKPTVLVLPGRHF